MQATFFNLADKLTAACTGDEVLLLNFGGEASDFIRFNNSRVRQPGRVEQQYLDLELIDGQRHASETVTLTGDLSVDAAHARRSLEALRERLPQLPEDPYLLYSEEVTSTEQCGEDRLPAAAEVVDAILQAGEGRDLVGIHAQGAIYEGFANSLGQRNWFSTHSFHFEWCFYAHDDKAVKSSYAGFEWSPEEFDQKVESSAAQLALLLKPAKTIEPGEYRVYLAPTALAELVDMLGWGGFGLKSHRTKNTCLLRMLEGGATFAPQFSAAENTAEGLEPNFTSAGYVKPAHVPLITKGQFDTCLVSPRSAKEYGEGVNAESEAPCSFDLAAGALPRDEVLKQLGTGVYCNQLWYLNWSDFTACRITGMTRFATFWVEGGEIVAPLNVMRFDETCYRALGSNLIDFTRERDFLPDASTYGSRSTSSLRVPGALIDGFRLTL